ncbi:FDLD family class I lanthipeptide [Clavibacter nebraskensis]|uniref:FDLD family class I lanthipeptide n=1 Tax=Clavibacter nebraskensis TaxID=31963 RepID=UPI003F83C77A
MGSITDDAFEIDVRVSTPSPSGTVQPASWTPLRTRTVKCSKSTCVGCTNTCASCGPGGFFC